MARNATLHHIGKHLLLTQCSSPDLQICSYMIMRSSQP